MAREHARVKLSIWEDDDFRGLSGNAQRLYFTLMTSLKLDYCGVTDWRPIRLAALCADWEIADVEHAGEELSSQLYIVIDTDTEEVLLRSFIRNDELLESPNMAVAMRKAHAGVASTALRQIVVHELRRLHLDKPDLKGWPRVSDMLDRTPLDPIEYSSFRASGNPSGKASGKASVSPAPIPSDNPSVSTSPTTAPNSNSLEQEPTSMPHKRGQRIPDDWKPSQADIAWQHAEGIGDLLARREYAKFCDYWRAKPGREALKLDWSLTWKNWLRSAAERAPQSEKKPAPSGRPGDFSHIRASKDF